MRGTEDEAKFRKFVGAISGFPPRGRGGLAAESVFSSSYASLRELASSKPAFPRAVAWRGYALALSVLEGWPLDGFAEELKLDDNQRLGLALQLTTEATGMDPFDYDLWWAHADVLLIKRDFAGAASAFEKAIDLNRDEVNPKLLAEAADAMVLIGDHAKADKLISGAFRRPDWHHWIKAHALFMKAGRVSRESLSSLASEELNLLNAALEQLRSSFGQPGDMSYLYDMQLLLAVIYARKYNLLDADKKSLAEGSKNVTAARTAMDAFYSQTTARNLHRAIEYPRYQDSADALYWSENVNAALGLSGRTAR